MTTQLTYSSVRPMRFAFLVHIAQENWITACLHILNYCTQLWGGYGSIIIPTDGNTIEPLFWDLLERFEPDEVVRYQRTGRDLEYENPVEFDHFVEQNFIEWLTKYDEKPRQDIYDEVQKGLRQRAHERFEISEGLQNEIRDRLSPFFWGKHVVQLINAGHSPYILRRSQNTSFLLLRSLFLSLLI